MDIEILDDQQPMTIAEARDIEIFKKKNLRKVSNSGGKAPHVAVTFKPLRKTAIAINEEFSRVTRSSKRGRKRGKNIECYDIDDDSEDENDSDDDDIQVLDNDDTFDENDTSLEEITMSGEVATDGFCDLCGLYLESISDIEKHHEQVHKIAMCKWCNARVTLSKIKSHIKTKCTKFVKILGSHCNIHNQMETDEHLQMEEFKNCRPWSCDACGQRYDQKSLIERAEAPDSFICPGCLHGVVTSVEGQGADIDPIQNVEEIDLDTEAPPTTTIQTDVDVTSTDIIKFVIDTLLDQIIPCSSKTIEVLNIEEGDNDIVVDKVQIQLREASAEVNIGDLEKLQSKNVFSLTKELNGNEAKEGTNNICDNVHSPEEATEVEEFFPVKATSEGTLLQSVCNEEVSTKNNAPAQSMDTSVCEVVDKTFEASETDKPELEKIYRETSTTNEVQPEQATPPQNVGTDGTSENFDDIEEISCIKHTANDVKLVDSSSVKSTELYKEEVVTEDLRREITSKDESEIKDIAKEIQKDSNQSEIEVIATDTHKDINDSEIEEITIETLNDNNDSEIEEISTKTQKDDTESEIQEIAVKTHKILESKDVVTVDEMLSNEQNVKGDRIIQENSEHHKEVVTLEEDNDEVEEISASKTSENKSPVKPVRRVARKSTKPPQNPQRNPSDEEMLLVEQKQPEKRKLESPTEPHPKIPKDSSKPASNSFFRFVDETSADDDDIVEVTTKEDTSVLLQSPDKDEVEIEEMVIC